MPAKPHAVSPDTLVNGTPCGPRPPAPRVETCGHLPLYINWHDMVLYLYRILAIQNKYVRLGFTILCLWTLYICTLRPSQKDTTSLQRGAWEAPPGTQGSFFPVFCAWPARWAMEEDCVLMSKT